MKKPMIQNQVNSPALFDLTGRTAVVAGGGGLLGAQFCRTLAAAGARVVVADWAFAAAAAVAEELNRGAETDTPLALAVEIDITSPDSNARLAEQTLAAFGRWDILVNSDAMDPKFDPAHADRSASGAFEDFPLEAWQQALDVNLTGMFLTCQAAVKPMLAQGRGVIINISSIYGLVAPDQRLYQQPGQPARYKPVYYSVTKAGVLGLSRYLVSYYGASGIRVNTLTPGGVFNDHDDDFVQAYAARAILGRMAAQDEMNGALLFLASDASAYMTGANLVVDGGWSAW